MKRKARTIGIYGGCILAVAMLVAFAVAMVLRQSGVYVSVTNGTDNAIRDVEIAYVGGRLHFPIILPGETYAEYARPQSETDLRLSYSNASGERHGQVVEVYIEPGYRGTVEINVRQHAVEVRNEIESMSLY